MFNQNTVTLSGRLGKDADIRTLPGGNGKVANFSLAVDHSWKDRLGKWQTVTEWHRVVTFQAGLIDKVLSKDGLKGRLVFVQGRLRNREYEKDGRKQYAHEIEVDNTGGIAILNEDK